MYKKEFLIIFTILLGFNMVAYAGDFCPAQTPNNDSYSIDQDHTLAVDIVQGVLSNDISENNTPISISSVNTVNPSHGTLTLNSDGSFTYIPEAGYFGTDTFRYKTNNGCSDSNDLATVNITVNQVNNAPVVTLVGDKVINLNVGDDLPFGIGATALDTEDGDVTSSIQLDSDVNNLVPGKYRIIYTAFDKFKASGSETRTVFVGAQTENDETLCKDGLDNDFDGNADKDDFNCASFYNTAPTINLLGDNPFTFSIGGTYSESGFTVSDNEQKISTTSVVVSNNISTTTLGTYFVKYSIQDNGGLFGYATRTVVVATTTENTSVKCSDNLDNDGDGKVDLSDSDCSPFVPVTPAPVSSGGGGGGGGGGSYVPVIPATTTATTTKVNISTASTTKQIGQVLGASTTCVTYLDLKNDYLARGHKNNLNNLLLLKKFLNSHLKLKIDLNNAFGPATQKAVMDFQLKYKDEILKPYAIKQPTGTVGKATANKINSLVCMQM
jgi:hypothetical protein